MDLVIIIQAVFIVLQVILFFKIWGMANNVKRMKERVLPDLGEWSVEREMLKGNYEEARRILLEKLIDEIENASYSIEELRKYYRPKFEKLNCQIPEKIEKLENTSDFKKLLELDC